MCSENAAKQAGERHAARGQRRRELSSEPEQLCCRVGPPLRLLGPHVPALLLHSARAGCHMHEHVLVGALCPPRPLPSAGRAHGSTEPVCASSVCCHATTGGLERRIGSGSARPQATSVATCKQPRMCIKASLCQEQVSLPQTIRRTQAGQGSRCHMRPGRLVRLCQKVQPRGQGGGKQTRLPAAVLSRCLDTSWHKTDRLTDRLTSFFLRPTHSCLTQHCLAGQYAVPRDQTGGTGWQRARTRCLIPTPAVPVTPRGTTHT